MKSGEVFDRLHPDLARGSISEKSIQTADTSPEPLFHVDKAHAGLAVHLGKCCHPLPGDKIVGIIRLARG